MLRNPLQTAVTQDGRKVVLHGDGRWEYAQQETKLAIAQNVGGGFRKTNWGMSKEEVKAIEGRIDADDSGNALTFNSQVAGLDCLVIYIFVQNKLVRGKYAITTQHSNDNSYLTDYANLKEMLSKKYGKPVKDNVWWADDLYKDNPPEWGMAVGAGHLTLYSEWSTPETLVNVILSGDNYQIHLGIEYVSKQLGYLEDQEKEQQALEDL